MEHPRILLQFDTDAQPSVFDAVVGIDSSIDHLLQYGNVTPESVVGLIHGAMFTRGPSHLKHTAVFIGGSSVSAGEAVAAKIQKTFFGPIRVSVMLDSNGSNTTAAAAVLCAARHLALPETKAIVLGGTGPVGLRVAQLLSARGSEVALVSRSLDRAVTACATIADAVDAPQAKPVAPVASEDSEQFQQALASANLLISCGAAGVELLSEEQLAAASALQVAIDLNAVAPAGIAGIKAIDKAAERGGRVDYGALGVGGLKMKIHSEAVASLFSSNDLFLDAEKIYAIGENLESAISDHS